jgi:hypothetical protein
MRNAAFAVIRRGVVVLVAIVVVIVVMVVVVVAITSRLVLDVLSIDAVMVCPERAVKRHVSRGHHLEARQPEHGREDGTPAPVATTRMTHGHGSTLQGQCRRIKTFRISGP